MENKYSILIVDPPMETPLQEGESVRAIRVHTAEEACSNITDADRRIGAVFFNPRFPRLAATRFIRLVRQHRPATPMFLLYDQALPFDRMDMLRMGISGAVKRGLKAESYFSLLSEEIFLTDGIPRISGTALPVKTDSGFLAVPISDFLTGIPTGMDVYVRLPSGRFLKLAGAKDTLTPARVRSYIEKGLTHFYLQQETHGRCLEYCDAIAKYLFTRPGVSTETKVSTALCRGQDLIDKIRSEGLGEEHVEYVSAFLSDVRSFISTINPRDVQVIRDFIAHMPAYDQAVKTTIVSSLLCLPLGIKSHSTFMAVGVASLLHDIGLYQLPQEIWGRDPASLTLQETQIYHTHPKVGADLLARMKGMDAVVIQAVAQHHQRRDGSGFPARPSTDTNRIAEIIGLSDEFVNRLARTTEWKQVLTEMEKKVFNGFSFEVSDAFRKVFLQSS